jgi:drug/metabolite transporter (DMT)-like permease
MTIASTASQDRVLPGIALMLTGIFVFSLNDALGKFLIATFSVGQILVVRSGAALVCLAPLNLRDGWGVYQRMPRPWLQAVRAVFATLEVAAFYWALFYMPLANVMTFYLAGPIYVTAMSPFVLREKVGWRRWLAVGAGFVGVLIALKPASQGFAPAALIAIAGSLTFSTSMMCTRLLRGTADTVLITAQTLAALVFGAIMAPFTWVALTWRDGGLLVLLGVTALFAHMCINRALKLAPASVVVPYQYTTIVWAILFGYVFFGDVPTVSMLVGAATIIGAGIYIFLREQAQERPATFSDPP